MSLFPRTQSKALASSQSAANQDLQKWAEQEENRAIKDSGWPLISIRFDEQG